MGDPDLILVDNSVVYRRVQSITNEVWLSVGNDPSAHAQSGAMHFSVACGLTPLDGATRASADQPRCVGCLRALIRRRNRTPEPTGPCCVCGRDGSDVTVHLVPIAADGSPDDPANLGPAHRTCAA